MIILITGASHTGKTALAQKLIEKYKYSCLSIDHLKMGLIRSGNTELTPLSDDETLTEYLWPIVCEMIKTAIENKQNMIVEGCYIPFDYKTCFAQEYLENIRCFCLVMSERYIRNHFEDIEKYANIIESRICDEINADILTGDNKKYLEGAKNNCIEYILIDDEYKVEIDI